MNSLLPTIDLEIMRNNYYIITIILGKNDLVVINKRHIITDWIMSNKHVISGVKWAIITVLIGNNVVMTM